MAARHFMDMLRAKWAEGKFVCVGLDSEYGRIPESVRFGRPDTSQVRFNSEIVEATADLVCAYKPNLAFYLRHGADGLYALAQTISKVKVYAPEVPVILDAKLADIGNTNEQYAQFAFDHLEADAITVHPYLGKEVLQPFLDRSDKGIFVLCRTSNPGAGEFQDQVVNVHLRGATTLYELVAMQVTTDWNWNRNCGLVTGATYPREIERVRRIAPDLPLLIPGIGKQGGDLKGSINAGMDDGNEGFIINSSSGIIFASSGKNFAEAARRETQKLHDAITIIRGRL